MRLTLCFIMLFFSIGVFASPVQSTLQQILQSRAAVEKPAVNLNEDNHQSHRWHNLGSFTGYQFVLFYRSTCVHCRRFDPILKAYSMQNAIPVKAFTTDGIALPSFPKSVPISRPVLNEFFGTGAQLAVPTLFIMNKHSRRVYPVSVGELSYLDLSRRLQQLLPKIKHYEEMHHD